MSKKETDNMTDSRLPQKGTLRWLLAIGALLVVCCVLIGLTSVDSNHAHPVYITEILASNTSYPNEDGRCCDFIELYNSADYAVDLSGFQLGDIEGNSRYAFPYGTIIDADSYLVVYCDKTVDDDAYASFGISRSGGETFYLIASNSAIADSVTTVAMDLDESMVLQEDGQWELSDSVTPGNQNVMDTGLAQDTYNSGVSPVRITEFSASGSGYVSKYNLLCDWIELYNTGTAAADISGYILSDNAGNDKYMFPEGTVLEAGHYLVVFCANNFVAEDIAPFGLSQLGGESVVLKNDRGMIIEQISTLVMDASGSMALGADQVWFVTEEVSPGFANTAEGHNAYLRSIGSVPGSVLVSELTAAAQYVLPDQSGNFSDWAELYNPGSETVDLSGWFLSDDPAYPQKWQFSDVQIQPGQRIVVYLSGQDGVYDGEIHADFSLSAAGESLILTSYAGTQVDAVTFGTSSTNQSFVFDSGEAVLLDTPTPGYTNDADGYEQFWAASVPEGPLAIWEVMVSNDTYLPQTLGACYDWVELRNISDETIHLSDYSISDDPDVSDMCVLSDRTLAPGQSVAIILSGDASLSSKKYDHAGFSLNAVEDQLFLFDSNGNLLDFVYLKDIPVNHSYGRSESSGGFFYMNPTPLQSNADGYRQISVEPTSTFSAGVYTSDEACVVPLSAGGTIYYTTDGSDPDTGSTPYKEPIQIDETTVLRAVSVEDGKMASNIYTATFIIQEPHSIPVVSLVTDPDNLWGSNGIYKSGDIDIKEEKRSANVAYCGEDGSFSLDCEISLHGATSVVAFPKKSFTVRFQDSYDGPLNYDVFEDGEVTTYRSLIVRTAHESTYSTHMRDILMADVASKNCDTLITQKYKYCALYLNGEYWGLYALREQHTAEHYASYMNVPADTVSRVHYTVDETNSLSALYKFMEKHGLRSEENYEYAKSVLDISSYIDWLIMEAYVSNFDIHGNMRFYHSTADNIWRCGLVDVDLGMFEVTAFSEIMDSFHHGKLVKALMQNEEFQDQLAKRMAELLAGPMSDENMLATIDSLADSIRDEIPLEGKRWGYTLKTWEQFVDGMRDYCDGRAVYMINNWCTEVGFTAEEKEAYFGHLLS